MQIQSSFLRTTLGKTVALFALALLTVCLSSSAFAAGRVVWKKTTIKERLDRHSWLLKMEIYLPRAPQVSYLPVKVEFKPTAYYERTLVDGKDEPIERTVPLRNQPSLIESVDVGFKDPGTNTIQKRTRFQFKVKRKNDYVAGEYRVTIKNARTGQRIGSPTTLRFKGENPVVDRRSMDFSRRPKKQAKEKEEEAKPTQDAQDEPETPAETEEAMTSEEPEAPAEAGNEPPAIKERPGGCQQAPSMPSRWGLIFALAAFGLMIRRKASAWSTR